MIFTKKKILKIIIMLLIISLLLFIFKDNINSIFNNVSNSFYRTIVEEKRYILLYKGLVSTIIVSLFSIIFGTILGIMICYFKKSNFRIISKITKSYIVIIQGIPITVLLLTFYYVIFGDVNISPMIVAIITFSIYFSAYMAEVFKGAIDSINISQIQSAYSLGFSKFQTLKYIILPQALSYTIPVYKNEVVSLIKLTSIAGYISIMDLTKASDIIRNRTYEAFFPLIITAIIYFIICYLLGKTLDLLYKRVNPRKFNKEKYNYVKS